MGTYPAPTCLEMLSVCDLGERPSLTFPASFQPSRNPCLHQEQTSPWGSTSLCLFSAVTVSVATTSCARAADSEAKVVRKCSTVWGYWILESAKDTKASSCPPTAPSASPSDRLLPAESLPDFKVGQSHPMGTSETSMSYSPETQEKRDEISAYIGELQNLSRELLTDGLH